MTDAKIAETRKLLAEFPSEVNVYYLLDGLRDALDALEAARMALWKYGQHRSRCPYHSIPTSIHCTCGLSKALGEEPTK